MRSVWILILVTITLTLTAPGLTAAEKEATSITTTRLTERLYQLSTDQGAYTTNSLVSVGSDGILIVDTQAEQYAEEFAQAIDDFGKGLPRIIINTHRHVEHVGGNAIFGPQPMVIAHDLVRTKLRSGSYLFEEFPDHTLPDLTFADTMTVYFNGEKIRLIALPGSHDDNEIIVHFTGSKVVHLSSVVNGFNFPSIDSDGSALAFPEVVAKALKLLPEDVVIVSGHNQNGSMDDLRKYHKMLVATIAVVRKGVAAGKDVATMQEEKVLDEWSSYAGSYVSTEAWIESVAEALEGTQAKRDVFEPLYYALKDHGAEAALALYLELKGQPDEYDLGEFDLLVVGDKLLKKEKHPAAVRFLNSSLEQYPESPYTYYTLYKLALAHDALGQADQALKHCQLALELKPENEALKSLLERLTQE